jgi:hypothetical protein
MKTICAALSLMIGLTFFSLLPSNASAFTIAVDCFASNSPPSGPIPNVECEYQVSAGGDPMADVGGYTVTLTYISGGGTVVGVLNSGAFFLTVGTDDIYIACISDSGQYNAQMDGSLFKLMSDAQGNLFYGLFGSDSDNATVSTMAACS